MNVPQLSLADRMRRHGELLPPCLYRTLMLAFADDLQAGGVVADICRDWLQAPAGAVVQLRLLAGLQRLVLTRRAPQLAFYYPNLGGDASPAALDQAWPGFRSALREHADELRSGLLIAPQTNEPGRSVPLLIGLFDAVRRSGLSRVRLLEPGASAGLNLLVDRYRIGGAGWLHGPADSPLQLPSAVIGPVEPAEYQIVTRRGCDLAPVDPRTEDGRLRLTSFVWPHHRERYERLRAALRIAAEIAVPVDQDSAANWLAGQLSRPAEPDVLTVVWHSVTRQYWPAAEVQAVTELIDEAGRQMPIAHIAMESWTLEERAPAELRTALSVPGGLRDPEPVRLAQVADHGVPATMLD